MSRAFFVLLAALAIPCCSPSNDARPDATGATCGNHVVDLGETCDGNCPAQCNDGNACTADSLAGGAASCDAACRFDPITACTSGDGCCPAGCTVATDSDCSAFCGDGVIEPGETCDGASCPTTCDDHVACTADILAGAASSCSAACSFVPITACAGGDGCCAPGCNANNDGDCSASCGNGVVEPGETCDGNCPTSCGDANTCTLDSLQGTPGACNVVCAHDAVTACTADGCCAAGCYSSDDMDCPQHTQAPTEACGTAADCATSLFCISEAQGFPGGFCYSQCMIDADCGAGNHCGFGGACVHDCATDDDCRSGYTCADYDGAGRTECMPPNFLPHP